MKIDTNMIVSVTEANQNFSRVTRIAEKFGQAVIFKNNKPKFILIDADRQPENSAADDIETIAMRVLERYRAQIESSVPHEP